MLPNGNHFQGMGSYPFMYEETSSGKLAFYARFGIFPLQSYRAFRFEWTGQPLVREMAMFGYSLHCNGTAAYYASWNGATQVASWTFFGSTSQNGTFTKAASAGKGSAFETFAPGVFKPFVYAIAYDSAGKELGKTAVVKTFVPSTALAPTCNTMSCPQGTNYTSTDSQMVCTTASKASSPKYAKRALFPLASSSTHHKHYATKTVTRSQKPVQATSSALHNKRAVAKTRTRHVTKSSAAHVPLTTSSIAPNKKRAITKTRTKHATKSSVAHNSQTTSSAALNEKRVVTRTKTRAKPIATKTRTRKGGPKATTTA